MKESKVEHTIDFVGSYCAKVVKNGALETIYIPYFGKFEAKMRQAGYVARLKGTPKPIIPIDKAYKHKHNDEAI